MNPIFTHDYDVGWCGFTDTGGGIADAIGYGERWERQGAKDPVVTHAFIVTGENQGIEAHLETGVAVFDLRKYSQDQNCALYFRKPAGWTISLGKRIAETAAKTPPFGQPYDTNLIVGDAVCDTLLGHALNWITRGLFKKAVCKAFNKSGRWICSEDVAFVLQQQPELRDLGCLANPVNTIDPQQLFEDKAVFTPSSP
jgi:hypothetical protein